MFLPELSINNGLPHITIAGIGGAGIHIIHELSKLSLPVDLVAMDSSTSTLESTPGLKSVRLGSKTSRGMGCGANTEAGSQAAHVSRNEIAIAIEGTELLILVAGLGGGVGSGGITVVADIARQLKIPTICFVTKPFRFEGLKRITIANTVISDLERDSQGVLSIDHDKLQSYLPKNISLIDAMKVGSQHLQQFIEQLLHVVQVNSLINVDFADILSLFRTTGKFAMGVVGSSGGENIKELIHQAIYHPLTSIDSPYRATGVLVFAEAGENFNLDNLNQATDYIDEISDERTEVILGINSMTGSHPLTITVLATGIRLVENGPVMLAFPDIRGRQPW